MKQIPLQENFLIFLLLLIVLSVLAVMLESVDYYRNQYQLYFDIAEWTFTIIFSLEYILRIISVKNPIKYMTSFYGIIDLLALIPSYLGFAIGQMPIIFHPLKQFEQFV